MRPWAALTAIVMLHGSSAAAENAPIDGKLLSTTACEAKPQAYAQWLTDQEKEYSSEAQQGREKYHVTVMPFSDLRPLLQGKVEFNQRRNGMRFACERITYSSSGLKVAGYIWRPADVAGKNLPLIIYNRGGGQELGKLAPLMRDGFYDFLSAGFVVIGSQYRGNDGGEGHDEEGGDEIADVLNLLPLARSLGYIDMSNVFMLGESRGGMMTFLAMKSGAAINAAAVVGAESDLASNLKRRPELEEDNKKQIPRYAENRERELIQRSAQSWPDKLDVPLLMLHGGKDWRVAPQQSLGLALKLDELQKPYELIVFEGDSHPLPFHWRERDQRIIDWFKAHMQSSAKEG